MSTVFIISLALLFYTYIGYALFLWIYNNLFNRNSESAPVKILYPTVALIIPAFNEKEFIQKKIQNSLDLDYPKEKLTIIFITDGSTDKPHDVICDYPMITHLHQDKRMGKFAAMKRAVQNTNASILVFTDANALINNESLKIITKKFTNPIVGVVAGEKRIKTDHTLKGVTAGESSYWKYESKMKKLNDQFNTVVGAAGELFAIRSELFEQTDKNYILDDFMLSLNANLKGFKTAYAPNAYAIEKASFSITDEYKRKVRIAAGGWQSIIMLLTNKKIYGQPKLLFQLISRRALRWMLAPLLLPIAFVSNLMIINDSWLYLILFLIQAFFYILAFIGLLLNRSNKLMPLIKIPHYFSFMHFTAFMGMLKYAFGKQNVLWEKVRRLD